MIVCNWVQCLGVYNQLDGLWQYSASLLKISASLTDLPISLMAVGFSVKHGICLSHIWQFHKKLADLSVALIPCVGCPDNGYRKWCLCQVLVDSYLAFANGTIVITKCYTYSNARCVWHKSWQAGLSGTRHYGTMLGWYHAQALIKATDMLYNSSLSNANRVIRSIKARHLTSEKPAACE